jgi:flagellar basal-body rod protein FlgC
MFGSLDISTSALVAQRTRITTIAANMANSNSITNADGEYEPYRRRIPVFASGDPVSGRAEGVHVSEIKLDESPLRKVYEPDSPYADADGYVGYPNINSSIEMVNALEASRAYEANITAAESTKQMIQAALSLLA